MMKGACLAIVASLLAAPSAAQQTIVGSWSGSVLEMQADGQPQVYPIRMLIDANGTGTIEYPTLACGGRLTPLGTPGELREFRETLTYGIDKCVDNGTVGVLPRAGKLIWYWTGEETSQPDSVASAVLRPSPTKAGTRP